jgi:predicted AAA+ superfamily ATPase
MISKDLIDFDAGDLRHRLLHGGLPDFFLADTPPERDFQEWLDSYWAKDILELFRLGKRHSFFKFMELLFAGSGGIFEATRFARACEVNRTTISNYLSVLEDTLVVSVIRPYSTHRSTEIVAAPKVYGFDTGFVCHAKGWRTLRTDDCGVLWEHLVMSEMQAHLQKRSISYWRNKRGHEVDFVLNWKNRPPTAVECKWSADATESSGLKAFRRQYPEGENWIVSSDVNRPYTGSLGGLKVSFIGIGDLEASLENPFSLAP